MNSGKCQFGLKKSLVLACGLMLTHTGFSQTMDATRTAGPAISTEVSLDYVSSYVFRGQTVNRRSALQPTVELTVAEQASLGVWGSFPVDRLEGELKQEVNVYLSYGIPLGMAELMFGATEYIYPEDDDENDRELSVGVALDTFLNPSLTAYVGIGGGIDRSQYYELTLSQDVWSINDLVFGLGGALGYISPDEGEEGFSHAIASISATYEVLYASANWILETNDRVNDLSGQEDFYVSVGTSFVF